MIYKSIFSSPLGYLEICADGADALTRIFLTSTPSEAFTESEITRNAAAQLAEYFRGERQTFTIALAPEGTAFQQQVWAACCEIPYGKECTPKELAAKIGDEKAAKKVLQALDANPVIIAVPDHRVKRKSNFLSGFSAGAAIKEALLGAEKNHLKKQ